MEGLKKLMRNKSVFFLVLAYAISQGVQEAILPVLDLDISPVGLEEVSHTKTLAHSTVTFLKYSPRWVGLGSGQVLLHVGLH